MLLSGVWGDSPIRVPLTVPFPWQFSTRRLRTLAPVATPASRPLSTPAMWVPWLSHLLAWRMHHSFTPRPIASKQVCNTTASSPSHATPCALHQLNPTA